MNRNKIIALTILLVTVVGGSFYLYTSKNDEVLAVSQKDSDVSLSPSSKPFAEEIEEAREVYEAHAYTTSTTSVGWDIQNVEGKVVHVMSGEEKNLNLGYVSRFDIGGGTYQSYSNFEDLGLIFSGITTISVTTDPAREPDFHPSSYRYWPVTLDEESLKKIPLIQDGMIDIHFCVLDRRFPDEVGYHKKYDDKFVSVTFNSLDIVGFNPNFDKSCTYRVFVE